MLRSFIFYVYHCFEVKMVDVNGLELQAQTPLQSE
jgi:hypothetical protein